MKKGLCYLCCLALLTACESNSDPEMERGESVPLAVKELTLIGEVVTRVTPGAVTTDGATIGVSQLAFNGYMSAYNQAYTYSAADGGGWSSATPICVDAREAKIVGVYDPNNVGAFPAGNTSSVSSANLTAQLYDEIKLWYFDNSSNTAVKNTNAAVAFTMICLWMFLPVRCKEALRLTTLPPQAVQSTGLVLSMKMDGQVRSVTIPYASLPKLDVAMQYNIPLKIVGPATLTISSNVTEGAWNTTSAVSTVTDSSGI